MSKKLSWLLFVLVLAVACSPSSSPVVEVKTPAAAPPAPKAAWQQRWDAVLAEAKKEGTVAVYNSWGAGLRTALMQAFAGRYSINVEFSPFARGEEILSKIQSENRAGLFLADVFGIGISPLLVNMKPEGVLGPIQPLLILPEVLDPGAWREGKIPFRDENGLALSLVGGNIRYVAYNSDLIKEGEITSYKDLLKPQYKGKITYNDPRVSGAGNGFMTHIWDIWGEAEAVDFLRRLIREQDAFIVRDNRLHVESVARGKYAIALATNADSLKEFITQGAPLKVAIIEDDIRVTSSAGAIGIPTRLAHPNATTVFVNWLLTKEGQSLFATTYGQPGTRTDASTEGINPLYVPAPGKKYAGETEKFLAGRSRLIELSKKIMDEPAK